MHAYLTLSDLCKPTNQKSKVKARFAPWLYPRLIWGGIWGLLFFIPLMQTQFLYRGLIFSLGPTLVQLFIVFPMKAGKGVMGFDLGLLTPLLVFVFNATWGVAASIWLKWVDK